MYYRAKDGDCAAAKAWWDKNEKFWPIVRAEWEAIFKTQNTITLKAKVENKNMNEQFTALLKQWNKKEISLDEVAIRSKMLLKQFTESNNVAVK